jgi:Co/Zn/Cd efflux system component
LNNFQWITALLNMGGKRSFLKMFSKRRNNTSGVIWASVLGLVVSAGAFLFRRNQDKDMFKPTLVSKQGQQNRSTTTPILSNAMVAEFSKELDLDNNLKTNK